MTKRDVNLFKLLAIKECVWDWKWDKCITAEQAMKCIDEIIEGKVKLK